MTKKAISVCAALIAGLGMSQVALADLTANASATSNYVWRGTTQTDNTSAVQGGIDYSAPFGVYVGTWVSNTAFGSQELDLYGGWSHEFGPIGIDVGVIRYAYPSDHSLSWNEGYAGVSASVGPVGLSLKASTTNDVFGTEANGLYVEAGAEMTIMKDIGLALHVGRYDFEFGDRDEALAADEVYAAYDDYIDYSLTVSKGNFAITLSSTNLSGEIDTANAAANTGGAIGDKAFAADDDPKLYVSWSGEWDLLK